MSIEIVLIIVAIVIVLVVLMRGKMNATVANPSDADVQEALRTGSKITAIKYYRQIHGVGLREAKDAIEAMSKER